MKKLLGLVLVLAVASLAVATPVYTLTPPSTEFETAVTVPVVASVTGNSGAPVYLMLAVDAGGILSGFAAGANAPASSAYFADVAENFPELGQGELWAMAHFTTGTPVYTDGSWLTANADFAPGSEAMTVTLYEFVESTSEVIALGSSTYTVPEPATIAVLSLGGLLLRRKK